MEDLPRPVTIMMFCTPECIASSTPYWISGLSTSGSISLGWAFVAGKNLVPSPAAGKTALRTFGIIPCHYRCVGQLQPHTPVLLVCSVLGARCASGHTRLADAFTE